MDILYFILKIFLYSAGSLIMICIAGLCSIEDRRDRGYQPKGDIDRNNPPKDGSCLPPKPKCKCCNL